MRLLFFYSCIMLLFNACTEKKKADAIFYNAVVYTVDSTFSVAEAFAVADGKIIAIGSKADILKYDATNKIDLQGRFVYPGFADAHCHFYGYGVDLKLINLTGTQSFNAIIDSLILYQDKKFSGWIFGRGWDQNDWTNKTYPDKSKLDSLFPDTPVFLMRIDGHAALVNQKALDLAQIKNDTSIIGGYFERKNNAFTGMLIDNALEIVKQKIPLPSKQAQVEALLAAQKNCFAVGLTSITDAGLDVATILLIDSLQKTNDLKIRYNAMIAYNRANAEYFYKQGKIETPMLRVSSFKLYGDGAMGSRGACMLQPYSDSAHHHGFMLHPLDSFKLIANEIAAHNFQLCTHAIGDSANRHLLNLYGQATAGKNLRWRIEHAQVVDSNDFHLFDKYSIIPSVQPTHATSDMYWAENRIGKNRLQGAYAYKKLLNSYGMVAAGSDFPVEDINPLYGFYAAVVRKDKNNFPDAGFEMQNALSRIEALKAMTIWAAYAQFDENIKGSLEVNKLADFVVLDKDLITAQPQLLWQLKVKQTYIGGREVYNLP
ncbi:MAG: amidohydrolase [Bacteroidia bacterium]|nr:amidohydrolase [Bacteroidia bacterium]